MQKNGGCNLKSGRVSNDCFDVLEFDWFLDIAAFGLIRIGHIQILSCYLRKVNKKPVAVKFFDCKSSNLLSVIREPTLNRQLQN